VGAAAVAVPDTLTVRTLLFLKLVVKVIVPVKVPAVVGAKPTPKTALEWPLRTSGSAGPLTAKAEELLVTCRMVTLWRPLLVKVTVGRAEAVAEARATEPKEIELGETLGPA